jgi:hypothetical protein
VIMVPRTTEVLCPWGVLHASARFAMMSYVSAAGRSTWYMGVGRMR